MQVSSGSTWHPQGAACAAGTLARGAIGAARLLACPSTGERYPPASMRLGEQGTVEVSATVGADGRVTGEAGQPVDGVVQLRLRWALEP